MKAYKLFRLLKDNSIAPLFINKKQRLEEGVWYDAENHPTKGFALRSGWHCCYKPIAPHLSMNLKTGEKRIWCEVDVEDVTKYDRPESQGGAWVLAERMKVVKRLPEITTTNGGDMSTKFTIQEQMILEQVATELDEFYVEDRKGRVQTKYVFEVVEDVWYDWDNYEDYPDGLPEAKVPDNLKGTWMMSHCEDLSNDTLRDCLKTYKWVKCKQVEKIVKVWEEV